ncbi:MAG: hypothetical protein RIF36_10325 [Imperialibacter sp.]|uniref:hypothetical protein n=1 Tax=Imperialibacter sp. TaxID=2038411 RepID=UPI0032EC9C80
MQRERKPYRIIKWSTTGQKFAGGNQDQNNAALPKNQLFGAVDNREEMPANLLKAYHMTEDRNSA